MSSAPSSRGTTAADRGGAAPPGGLGGECLGRPTRDRHCLDLGRGDKVAGDPAQLGGLCAASLPARHLDPGTAAQGLGQSACLRDTAARSAPGSWTLLDPETMLAAAQCTSPFPNGEIGFVEDRIGPPSRAYLKLWEALTLIGSRPGPGERRVDLGSSPGGRMGLEGSARMTELSSGAPVSW